MTSRSLDRRVVIVTGAGRGLGRAIAARLGADGAHVVVAEIDAVRGAAAAGELAADGIDARFVHTDVADEASVAALVGAAAEAGPIWGVVNNAALADGVGGKLFHEITVAEWDRIMTVNARGPWLVSRAVAPRLIAVGGGRIVNLASDAALYGSPRLAHYVSSKGAVIALTRAMARELGQHGVTVNAVAPGLTLGEAAGRIPADRHELYRQTRLLGRDQEPRDVTGVVAFLLGDDAGYLTGQLLVVDGGFVLH